MASWIGYGSLPQGDDPGVLVFVDPSNDMVAARAVLAWPEVTESIKSLKLPKMVRLPQPEMAKALDGFLRGMGIMVNTDAVDSAMEHMLYLAQAEAASDLHLRRMMPEGTAEEVLQRVREALADWQHEEAWVRVPRDMQLIAADLSAQLVAIAMGDDAPKGVMVVREGNPDIGVTLAYSSGRAFGIEGDYPTLTNYEDARLQSLEELDLLLIALKVVQKFAGLRRYERADPNLKLDVPVTDGMHRTLYIQSSQTKR